MQPMTQTEYAKHRGVARQTIHKMLKAGKIPVGGDGKIDPAAADFALGEHRLRVDEPRSSAPAQYVESAGLTRARTATEIYKARIAQLEYQKRLGNLLSKDGVVDAASRCAEVVVRIITGLSMRAEELAAAGVGGAAGVRVLLKSIEREQRTRVAAAFTDLAEQAVRTTTHEAESASASMENQDEAV